MQKHKGIIIILICFSFVFMAGCTSTSQNQVVTTIQTPVPTVSPSLTTVTTVQTIVTLITTITTQTVIPTPISDPILHRYIRQFDLNGVLTGYEFKFYSDGTVNYKYGTTTTVNDNIKILNPSIQASGTWTNLGDGKYLVKFLPSGMSGAQIVREYTLVPAHQDPSYPGIIIKEHIESSYETDAIVDKHARTDIIYFYPELAKID